MSGPVDSVASLLSFLDAPIVVGDPEGHVIYVNPAFERRFARDSVEVQGIALLMLFGGGGREAILQAVAEVCSRGETVKFRLREAEGHYLGLASPIVAADDRVGVVILLTDEPPLDDRLLAYQNEIGEPLEDAMQCFDELLEQTGGRRDERYREVVERGAAALERARKWSDQLRATLRGSARDVSENAVSDPAIVVRRVVSRLESDFERAGVDLHLLVPSQLCMARGDPAMIETAIGRLLQHRLAQAPRGGAISVSARTSGEGETKRLLFAIVDQPTPEENLDEPPEDGTPEPRVVRATVAALGGRICTISDPAVGRVTAIALALAEAS